MEKRFNALWCSDQHTLHPHTSTQHILDNLSRFYYKDNNLSDIDLSVWGGDFFHDLAPANDSNLLLVHRWVKKYLHSCHERKVHVRILEGTSSHDWGQPETLEVLKPKGSPYIKYINTLSIEFIPELDINVMYVPDNFGKTSTEDIYDRAVDLLANHNLTQVDFIFLHGGFVFQLPPVANKHGTLFDEMKWSKLAKHAIFSGHIHKPGKKYNIYCSGSFDRIAHGEMHPKGAYRFSFNKEHFSASFYENTYAQIYDTIQISPETNVKQLTKIIDNYLRKSPPPKTRIKVKGGLSAVTVALVNEYKDQYPMYHFETDNVKEENIDIDATLYSPEDYKAITLTKDNLKSNLFNFMEPTIGQNDDIDKEYLEQLLDEVMNG